MRGSIVKNYHGEILMSLSGPVALGDFYRADVHFNIREGLKYVASHFHGPVLREGASFLLSGSGRWVMEFLFSEQV